jgi:hypothetical protein
MFKIAMVHGNQISGCNTNYLLPCFFEFIAFQMYQLAPLEFEEWIKLIPEQCKQPTELIPELAQAREDLYLTLEMVTNTP